MSTQTLENRTALVTGGGQGLGAAISAELAQQGMRVWVADAIEERARAVAAQIGPAARALQIDVADAHSVYRALQAMDMGESLDVLVNNAGVDVTLPISELSERDWRRVLSVNLDGPFLLAKAALPLLRAARGHIVNICSTASRRCWPNASAYHASKWGLLGLSHALHAELRALDIRVTAVIAGGMRTPFLLERFPDIDAETLQDPENVARTVAFVLKLPPESVIPEVMVLPRRESSWP